MKVQSQYYLGPSPLLTIVEPIGPWNMVATFSVMVFFRLSYGQIRQVYATIYNDFMNFEYPLGYSRGFATLGGDIEWDGWQVSLLRRAGGFFDDTDFDDAVMNRGFVTVNYVQ